MAQIPIERLLGGVRPQEISVGMERGPMPPAPVVPVSPTPAPTDPNEAMRQLVMLLLRIPGIRELLIAELQKVQQGIGVANRMLERPMLPPAAGTTQSSFLERLRQLRDQMGEE